MAHLFPRTLVLALALVSTAGSGVVLAEDPTPATNLTIGVTVDPVCTIAVTPGEWSADDAVELDCRNLPDSHPEPLVQEATAPSSTDEVPMTVVINF